MEKPSVGRSARRRASFFDGQSAICKLFKKSTKICHDCPVYCSHSPGGNTETSPQSLRFPPRNVPESAFSCGCGCRRSAQQVLTKNCSPFHAMATARDGEQTTNTLLTGRNCSGVSIQRAAPLSSSFPRCCLLFVFYLPGTKSPCRSQRQGLLRQYEFSPRLTSRA